MGPDPELSSLISSLEELGQRVTRAAEEASATGRVDAATEFFAAERALREAIRRLRRAG